MLDFDVTCSSAWIFGQQTAIEKYFPSAKEDREEMGAARCEKYLKKCRKRVKKRGAESEAGRASAKRSRH